MTSLMIQKLKFFDTDLVIRLFVKKVSKTKVFTKEYQNITQNSSEDSAKVAPNTFHFEILKCKKYGVNLSYETLIYRYEWILVGLQ